MGSAAAAGRPLSMPAIVVMHRTQEKEVNGEGLEREGENGTEGDEGGGLVRRRRRTPAGGAPGANSSCYPRASEAATLHRSLSLSLCFGAATESTAARQAAAG